MPDLDAAFDIAAANSKNLIDHPQGGAQFELHAYHQQAQHGDNHAPQSDVNDAAALATWAAWTRFAGLDRAQARQQYVTLLGAIG